MNKIKALLSILCVAVLMYSLYIVTITIITLIVPVFIVLMTCSVVWMYFKKGETKDE